MKVAVGIANFTGLYYSIALLTDSAYRTEFLDTVTVELRGVFADRARYLELREALGQPLDQPRGTTLGAG